MSIMNFFANLFNGSVFTMDMAEYRDRTNAAEAAAAAANTRANKLDEENAILKSDKVTLAADIVKLQGDIASRDAQLGEHAAMLENLSETHKDTVQAYDKRIVELEANQRPPRVNGKFVSTKAGKATAKDAAKGAKVGSKVAKPPKIGKPAV